MFSGLAKACPGGGPSTCRLRERRQGTRSVVAGRPRLASGEVPERSGARMPAVADDWISEVAEFFDGVAPRVQSIPIAAGGKKPVVALHIETGRAPFVVRRAGGGLETPWMDANGVRSAGRLELVQLLSPLQDLPSFEVLEADLSVYKNPHVSAAARATFRWTLDASVYVLPQGDSRVILPLHQCRGAVRIDGSRFRSDATDFSLTADKNSPAIRVTESAALVEGLGRFFVYCCGSTREPELPLQSAAELLMDFTPAGSNRAATASATLRPEPTLETNQAGRWKL